MCYQFISLHFCWNYNRTMVLNICKYNVNVQSHWIFFILIRHANINDIIYPSCPFHRRRRVSCFRTQWFGAWRWKKIRRYVVIAVEGFWCGMRFVWPFPSSTFGGDAVAAETLKRCKYNLGLYIFILQFIINISILSYYNLSSIYHIKVKFIKCYTK